MGRRRADGWSPSDLGRRAAVAIDNAQLLVALQESDRAKDVFLATLAHELRALVGVHDALDAGRPKDAALREAGVFGARTGPIGRAAGRIDARRARRALRAVAEIDRASKGLGTRDPWQLVTALCLGLANAPRRAGARPG